MVIWIIGKIRLYTVYCIIDGKAFCSKIIMRTISIVIMISKVKIECFTEDDLSNLQILLLLLFDKVKYTLVLSQNFIVKNLIKYANVDKRIKLKLVFDNVC